MPHYINTNKMTRMKKPRTIANWLQREHMPAHRGVIDNVSQAEGAYVVFGNDGDARAGKVKREIAIFRTMIDADEWWETSFETSSDGNTWVMLIDKNEIGIHDDQKLLKWLSDSWRRACDDHVTDEGIKAWENAEMKGQ